MGRLPVRGPVPEPLRVIVSQQRLHGVHVFVRKSAIKNGACMMESEMDLEISDLPPPDTVLDLWQRVPSAVVPISRHCPESASFSRRTL